MSQIPQPDVPTPAPSTTVTTTTTKDDGSTRAPSVTTVETAKAVEPGWQTTEFWQSMVVTVGGIGLLIYGCVKGNDQAVTWGSILAGISAGGYALGRGIAKK